LSFQCAWDNIYAVSLHRFKRLRDRHNPGLVKDLHVAAQILPNRVPSDPLETRRAGSALHSILAS
jgi:hypothetical protein